MFTMLHVDVVCDFGDRRQAIAVFSGDKVFAKGLQEARVPSSSVFFSHVRPFVMGRRGWASVAAPAGWYGHPPSLGAPSQRVGAKAQG